ncbi:hypothetical protein Tco_0838809, partial [Tanacetum coccineum]
AAGFLPVLKFIDSSRFVQNRDTQQTIEAIAHDLPYIVERVHEKRGTGKVRWLLLVVTIGPGYSYVATSSFHVPAGCFVVPTGLFTVSSASLVRFCLFMLLVLFDIGPHTPLGLEQ